ncbi:MAG: sigma-54-dependent transcriptional regulator [Planctomycetota bacterium]|jgi:DNA-binding NtrC family response regulator
MSEPSVPLKILFVDDEENMRTMLDIILSKEGYDVDLADSGRKALELFEKNSYDLVIQDLTMPEMDGIELLERIKDICQETIVIIMTAHSTWSRAVDAMRLGAYDYIKKPFDNTELKSLLKRALSHREFLKNVNEWDPENCRLIGTSGAVKDIYSLIKKVGPTDSTVIIQGESGVGKEMVARLIHMNSLRADKALISVNCGAFAENLLESELFGHIKGAFTGAVSDKDGLVAVAENGTLFLDEIAEMSLQTQVRFLRLLENREYSPVGSTEKRKINVRFIAATNKDLEWMIKNKQFREDLYYRLNVIPVNIPPLRDRKDDIPLLAGYFLAKYAEKLEREVSRISDELLATLINFDWPGNIRELENAVQRAVTLCHGDTLTLQDMENSAITKHPVSNALLEDTEVFIPAEFSLEKRIEEVERDYILKAVEQAGGNITNASDLLGISFRQLRYKIKKLGIS